MITEKNTKLSLLIVIISALMFSCQPKPIPIELPELESKPVIWSQVIPGNISLIYFSRSFSALEYQENDTSSVSQLLSEFLVENGDITITHNGEIDTLFKLSDGVYATLTTTLIEGDTYFLNATDHLTGKSVNAATTLMPKINLDTITAESIDTSSVKLTYRFTDPSGPNWYAIHVYTTYADPLTLDDPLAAENVVSTELVSDLEIPDGQVEFTKTIDFVDSDTLYVSFNNISEELFNYLSQRQRGGTIYNQLVQEPINYLSNINNGYGMFSLSFPDIHQIEIP